MSLIINGARRRIIFRGMLVLAAYLLIFSPCMGNDDNHLLLWMTNRTNGVMSGQADGLHNPTVRWSTSKGAVDDQIYDMFLLSTAKNPYFEVYIDETATNYGFKVNCTPVWKSVYGKYERYFYVSGFYVASTSDATKIKAFSIPGDQIWSRSLNLSEIGVNKGLLDSNLIVK